MAKIPFENIESVVFKFDTIALPPPFCHRYEILCDFNKPDPFATLDLDYYDRDTVDPEEILNEGFTMDDNYHWKGPLHPGWKQAITDKLKRANWRSQPVIAEYPQAQLLITVENKEDGKTELYPDNLTYWEPFLQEVIQAIFEAGERERPLELHILEIDRYNKSMQMSIVYFFARREVQVRKEINHKSSQIQVPWTKGQALLKEVFYFDYNYDQAATKQPKKEGIYLDSGDGWWHNLGQFLSQPGKTKDKAEILIRSLREL